jgi:hypothetical protein
MFNSNFYTMKKNSLFLSLVAFVFAITTALAFKPATVVNPGYFEGGICKPTTSVCAGGSQACRIDIEEDNVDDLIPIGDRNNNCAQLSMP